MAGRLTKFTPPLAHCICERIADGESLRSICRDDTMPAKSTVIAWLADDAHQEFRAKYALAREIQADGFVDEMVEIADDGSTDWMEKRSSEGEVTGYQENGEALRRSQLRILTRQWIAEKLKPKKYGTKIDLNHDGKVALVPQISSTVRSSTTSAPIGTSSSLSRSRRTGCASGQGIGALQSRSRSAGVQGLRNRSSQRLACLSRVARLSATRNGTASRQTGMAGISRTRV